MIGRRGFLAGLAALAVGVRAVTAHGTYEGLIRDAAARWGASGDLMVAIANCESGGDAGAVSNRLNVNGTSDLGLFQINELTWRWWSDLSGLYGDPFNAWDNANLAGWAIANGHEWAWTCRGMV